MNALSPRQWAGPTPVRVAGQVEVVHVHVLFEVVAGVARVDGRVPEGVHLTLDPVGQVQVERGIGKGRVGTGHIYSERKGNTSIQ